MTLIITEKAPAKINLALDTPMRYIDGLPRWNMVMNSIDLADYVIIETHQHQHRIKVYTDSSFLPNDQRNLAYQAAHILKNRFKNESRWQLAWAVAHQTQRLSYEHLIKAGIWDFL